MPDTVAAREIVVDAERAGERVDRFLAQNLALSRGYVRRLIRRGAVRIGERSAAKGDLLRAGDRITVATFRHPDEGPLASPEVELALIRSDAGLVAFDKPAGMPTHPLEFDEATTALNAALARYPEIAGVGEGGLHSGVVHRLDTDTSGVLVFARTEQAYAEARRAFAAQRVLKRYVARVHGVPTREGEITLRLDHRGPRMKVVERGGREAITRILRVIACGETALVEIEIPTGVTHQIRATLAHLGHPVVGDAVYGPPTDEARHWLHARYIRLPGFEATADPPPPLTLASSSA